MSEDRFVTPAGWRGHLLPRRDWMPVPYAPEPGAAAGLARLGAEPGRTPPGEATR
ncbi:hypothetical protein ACQP2P_11635 [Dactylosporangium sp. CA-139114]|uniref:hypothetical protein n=1 Tax=Dactylosporangium sp. CA-139114 TaxID=3239931 RepID=UPI003D97EC9E